MKLAVPHPKVNALGDHLLNDLQINLMRILTRDFGPAISSIAGLFYETDRFPFTRHTRHFPVKPSIAQNHRLGTMSLPASIPCRLSPLLPSPFCRPGNSRPFQSPLNGANVGFSRHHHRLTESCKTNAPRPNRQSSDPTPIRCKTRDGTNDIASSLLTRLLLGNRESLDSGLACRAPKSMIAIPPSWQPSLCGFYFESCRGTRVIA